MGLIPQETIDDVLARTDIVSVIGQYVTLKRAGTNHKGLCPFHEENTPSFHVHNARGIYKCFGCGAGGNVIQFLMNLEGWSFPETVRHLAGSVGVEIPEEDPEEAAEQRKRRQARELYRKVMNAARDYYEEQLWGEGGAAARAYLERRGIGEETARAFRMGYAPAGWQNLLDALGVKGINAALVERAGMAISRSSSGSYDRFRERVMFPVIDIWGHTLAFGGRVFVEGDEAPKYINSSETRFYTKGRQLFGLHAAKKGIQREESALLVEGNFDVIALHAYGVDNAVAPMGTAFTEAQARLLKRYARHVVIAFDGDSAGEAATAKCLESCERAGLKATVARFEQGDDPDTFVRREGADALKKMARESEPLVAWSIERVLPIARGGVAAPIEERMAALEQAAGILDKVQDKIAWNHYAEELERRLEIDPKLFRRYLKRPEKRQDIREEAKQVSQVQSVALSKVEFKLLTMLLDQPGWLVAFVDEELSNLLASAELAEFLGQAAAYARGKSEAEISLAALTSRARPELSDVVTSAADAAVAGREYEDLTEYDQEHTAKLYADTLRELKYQWSDRSIKALEAEYERLDFTRDRDRYVEVMNQLKQLRDFRATHSS
jgi:DNA primase